MKGSREDERDLIKSIERGQWRGIDDVASAVVEAQQLAAATIAKSERMNVRISSADLNALKAKAISRKDSPSKPSFTSVLHEYVTGTSGK